VLVMGVGVTVGGVSNRPDTELHPGTAYSR